MNTEKKTSTESYKGVRDFYPEDKAAQAYLFKGLRSVVERFGYVEYDASLLEPSELYRSKGSEEIVNEQTYTFTDRGGREVTLRPEMTPSVARMVAAKRRELSFPLRWYSIPNLFRYERPQRGRLREHWQLNVDLFGVDSVTADVEVLSIAHAVLRHFKLEENQFEIRIGSRSLLNALFQEYGLTIDQQHDFSQLLDKKQKISTHEFDASAQKISENWVALVAAIDEIGNGLSPSFPSEDNQGKDNSAASDSLKQLRDTSNALEEHGVGNVVLDPSIVRGFDYYTGMVFEVFDTGGKNNRSLFGGGRYNDLLSMFGDESVPAVGFGMGDVTLRDVLGTYNLVPEYASPTRLYLCVLSDAERAHAHELANELRAQGINVAIDLSNKSVGDQVKKASRDKIPYVVCIGANEVMRKQYTLKKLADGEERQLSLAALAESLKTAIV